MRSIYFSLVCLCLATPAYAEVCDKERPDWWRGQGRVDRFEDLYLFLTTPLGMALIGAFAVALMVNRRWISISVATALSLVATVIMVEWLWLGNGIDRGAHLEGCRGSRLAISEALFFGAAVLVGLGLFTGRLVPREHGSRNHA